eukprot:3619591-Pyramimonas_sp.AAC.1
MNLDDNAIIPEIKIQDQPIGYNHNAPFSTGVTNIRTPPCWEPPEPVFIGQEDQRPRPKRVAFVDDD